MDEIGRSVVAFNAMIQKIQESSEEVRQKTADIHAMLHYIPQGILTLESGGIIHPEFSEHLKTVLETPDLAGRDVMHAVFDGTGMGADALNQMETAISACIGEDTMNFEFNAHLLPHDIRKTFPDGRTKVLDLNWSPITDESGTTLRLLLCLRDVTELRALAQAADAQKKELAIIGEILAVRQEKFQEFMQGALQFVDENEALLAQAHGADAAAQAQAISILFRNMHTIKGNARTHGLQHLTDVVHAAEESYDRIRQGRQAWDTATLQQELALTRSTLEQYAQTSEVTLGRKGPGRRGSVDSFLMVPKEKVESLLGELDALNLHDSQALAQAVLSTREVLRQLGTEPLPHLLSGVTDSLPSLAGELGKNSPQLAFEDNGVRVRHQVADTLRNVFMHLYRNAMDHGLETPAERRKAGKPETGTITLRASLDAEQLALRLRDDGRGLALQRIRSKAIEQGLIAENTTLPAQDIAQLIFASGFSTASAVTDISGRGVGMDAVKGFVQSEGGSIALHLMETDPQATHCAFETVITLPARFALQAA